MGKKEPSTPSQEPEEGGSVPAHVLGRGVLRLTITRNVQRQRKRGQVVGHVKRRRRVVEVGDRDPTQTL